MPQITEALGLIAGQGNLPLETARGMRAAGRRVICAALAGNARVEELRSVGYEGAFLVPFPDPPHTL